MTAAELIDLLKRHQKACERLGITLSTKCGVDYMAVDATFDGIDAENGQVDADFMRRWLLGACVEWCDEHGIEVLKSSLQRGVSQYVICRHFVTEDTPYKSRLHACLAAIENHTP